MKFRIMRHFIFGKDGRTNILEDGNSFLVALDRVSKTIFEWDRTVSVYLRTGQLLGQYAFPDAAAYTQLVADWNSTPDAIQIGTARKMVIKGFNVIAITLRSTLSPVVEVESPSATTHLQINAQALSINAQRLLINA